MSDSKEALTDEDQNLQADRVELERLQAKSGGAPAIAAKAALDRVQVTVSVELGQTQITVKELRLLRHGQIFRLNQKIGEPLGIYVNGQKLAYGEVVAVDNDYYGIRVTALVEDSSQQSEEANA